MLFLVLYNANIGFTRLKKHSSKSYTTTEIFFTITLTELIDKRKFVKAIWDKILITFIILLSVFKRVTIYFS